MKKLIRLGLPVAVLVLCLAVGITLIRTSPKAERRPPPPVVPTVEVVTVRPDSYPVVVRSQGTVVPRTESTLIPEVSGQVVKLSPNFQAGGFFESGEILLEIDARDYENAMVVARADLTQASATLDEEKARSEQARRDWQVLGLSQQPNALALRQPQLKSAQAAVAAAQARLEQARINLERTRIRAPYTGLVLEKRVDVGQYVSPGTLLARIYAIDFVEVRLPLTNDQLAMLILPQTYRDDATAASDSDLPEVELEARIGRDTHRWLGRIVRTEGAMDTQSQQIFVVAQITDPYSRRHPAPLKVGQFVEARIGGRVFQDVFVVPRSVVRRDNEVLVVSDEQTIERRQVQVVWSDVDHVVIDRGLSTGDRVSVTPLPYAITGTRVQVSVPATSGQPQGRQ